MLTPESMESEIDSLKINLQESQRQIRLIEKWVDTRLETPWWKQVWFIIDGWPRYRLVDKPQWRPWHRFTK